MSLKEYDKIVVTGYKYYKKLENYMEVAREVKNIVLKHWPTAEVYVFGSVVRGRYTASSDIDILVVLENRPSRDEEYNVKAEVYSRVDAPIELHVASRTEYEKWYKRFIGEEIVKV